MWVLDTNIISELRKPKPHAGVVGWITAQPATLIWTTRLCLAEIKSGIALQPDQNNAALLTSWYADVVVPMFGNRILDVDEPALLIWLDLMRQAKTMRQNAPPVDMLIAAICNSTGNTIATRDVTPFAACGVPTFNPFTGERFNGA